MGAESGFSLGSSNILIVGLGLMGGSLALALNGKCASITGLDIDPDTRSLAVDQQIVEAAYQDLGEALANVDVIILATPVNLILDYLRQLARMLDTNKNVLVLDLGSTKAEICREMEKLPSHVVAIGCHPICGKESLSLRNAERTLYFGAPFLVTQNAKTTPAALSFVTELAGVLGSKMALIDAETHDAVLANISHLPYLISTALAMATPAEIATYVGPGFRSTTRLAGTSSSMMMSIIASNRENILNNLERFSDELAYLTSVIAENDQEGLRNYLDSARENYLTLKG